MLATLTPTIGSATPMLGDAIWIGGGTLGLLLVIVIVVLLVRR